MAQGVGDGALLAEIRQRDDDAVDLVAVFLEQVGAERRFRARFDGAELGLFRTHGATTW
jgi:hypothetical protein